MAVRFDPERKRWKVEFEQGGERVFHRLPKGCTRAQAETWEGLKRREIFDRVSLDKKPDVTIGDAIDLWLQDNRRKNQRGALSEARQWEPWRGRLLKDAPEVSTEAVQLWSRLRLVTAATDRRSAPSSSTARNRVTKSSTINRRLMLLKAVCKRSWRQKLIGENLSGRIETLREPPPKEIYLTRQQVKSLAGHPRIGNAILTLVYTGLRATELVNLSAADMRGGTLTVLGKGDKRRDEPVPPIARSVVRSALPVGLSYWQLRKEFISARKKAKLPPTVTLHTLRHTCASWLINAGVDLYTVGKILGHSSTQTTTRYAHLATDTLEKAMRRLK